MKTASIITTIKHNVGDDFVREGILALFNEIQALEKIELIHKHSPVTSNYGFENIRSLRASRVIEPVLRFANLGNKVSDANILIQSGAPVYWCHPDNHCANNEWFDPLIRKRFLKDRRGRKFLNIAGGSCQAYYSDGSEINNCPKCKAYIAEFFDACDLTLLRDVVAKNMLNNSGRDADVLPCTSIFARDFFKISPSDGGYVVVNFMETGGHYTFGQEIDAKKWRRNFLLVVKKLQPYGRVVAACHTIAEKNLVESLIPEIETYIVPDEHIAFMNFYAGARLGIVNRVHAAFMMASFGKPVSLIGNDTRALMIKNLNLTSYFVDDVDEQCIDLMIDELLMREKSYLEEIELIRKQTRATYINKIKQVLLE